MDEVIYFFRPAEDGGLVRGSRDLLGSCERQSFFG